MGTRKGGKSVPSNDRSRMKFDGLNVSKQLLNAIADLGFEEPTPIQAESHAVVLSGKDMVGIAQTGTGKTLAYMLPILQDLKYSKGVAPMVLVLVPTRELVIQVTEQINEYAKYMSIRALGIYGGVNIHGQADALTRGTDIVVATPGRLYDLAIRHAIKLKSIKKLVIDEVDVMLDLGFRFQLSNIFELLPERRQNIMFSATMTEEVDVLIDEFFIAPVKISIAVSGTPLENINQERYEVPNFYTKVNLLSHLLRKREEYKKVLVFTSSKRNADFLFETLQPAFESQMCIIHSNKSQNYRNRSIEQFDNGSKRILIATDVIARGLDLEKITHVINFDVPVYAENYMHRIGRTGRAKEPGTTIVFSTPKETEAMGNIERLMNYNVPISALPTEVEISPQLTADERPEVKERNPNRNLKKRLPTGEAVHEKKAKNMKENLGGSYRRELKAKYKKPKTRGDKKLNRKKNR